MKRVFCLIFAALVALTTLTVCGSEAPETAKVSVAAQPVAAGYTGTVVETMSTAGYTYVQVDTGTEKIWAAAPEMQVKVGDKVTVPPGAPMRNFHSKTLNRSFDFVYFVPSISVPGAGNDTGQSTQWHSGGPGGKPALPALPK